MMNALRSWSEAKLERLAALEPEKLIEILKSETVSEIDLSFAAEKAGTIETEEVTTILLKLLEHPSPIVREGALYGLAAREVWTVEVEEAIRRHSQDDDSKGVREAAAELLIWEKK